MSYLDGADRSAKGMDAPSLQFVLDHFAQFGEPYTQSVLNAVSEPGALLVGLVAAATMSVCHRRRKN